MAEEQKIEQQNISPEQVHSAEQVDENFLDSTKIEQIPQPQVTEKIDKDQIVAQVIIPDNQVQQSALANSEIIHREVDSILSAGMDNTFLSLDAGTQRIFKIKGEETAKKITILLMQTKIKVAEITKLILDWLRIIPRVNKYYLEQEAKIKTEKILKINQLKNG